MSHTEVTRSDARRSRRSMALLAVLALSASAALLSACNTLAGAGQDVSSTGNAVTNGAEKVKSGL
jgi:entericidin B